MSAAHAYYASDVLKNLKPIEADSGMIFGGGKPSKTKLKAFAEPCAFTPKTDPDYILHESSRDVAIWFMADPEPLYLWGPTGCGKTSLVKNIAAKLNYPVFEANAHARLDYETLVGHQTVRNGNIQFQYGALSLAMKHGGLFLLNEIDVADPAVLCGLNTILDGSPLCISENDGELIEPHPHFRFVATANTNGLSDQSGMYQGVMQQNMAFLDRFWMVEVDYPDANAETALLAKVAPQLSEYIRDKMVFIAREVRDQFINQNMEITFSTRSLIRWAEMTILFKPLAKQNITPITYALMRAVGFRASKSTQVALDELVKKTIDPRMLADSFNGASQATQHQVHAADWDFLREILKDLHAHFQSNPTAVGNYFDQNKPRVYLTQNTPSGGKFWECEACRDKLLLTHGPLGRPGAKSISISVEECNKSIFWEMMTRAEKKMNEGYSLNMANSSISRP